MSVERWRDDNDRWLGTRLHQLRLRMESYAAATRRQDGRDPASWWLVADGVQAPPRSEAEVRLDAELTSIAAGMSRPPALAATAVAAGLGPLETDLLLLAACTAYDGGFTIACAELHGDARRDHPTALLGLQLFAGPGDRLRALDVLLPCAPLRRLRLVELPDDDEPLLLQRLGVDERVADYLRGVNHVEVRLTSLLAEVRADGDTIYVDTTAGLLREAVMANDDRWVAVNLTGPADCGARDVVVRAADALDLRPALVDLDRLAARAGTTSAETSWG